MVCVLYSSVNRAIFRILIIFSRIVHKKYRLKPGHITDILCFDSGLQFFFLDYFTDHEKKKKEWYINLQLTLNTILAGVKHFLPPSIGKKRSLQYSISCNERLHMC